MNNRTYTIAVDTGKAQVKSAMLLDGEVLTLNAFPSQVVKGSTKKLDESVHIVNLNGEIFLPSLLGLADIYNMHSAEEKVDYSTILKGYEILKNTFVEFNK